MALFQSLFSACGDHNSVAFIDDLEHDGPPELKKTGELVKQQQSPRSQLKQSSSKCDLTQLRIVKLLSGPTCGNFGLLQVLGVGQSGKVILARHNDQSAPQFALKMMRKSEVIKKKQVARVIMEHRVLQMFDSPFITRLHYSFQVRRERRPDRALIPPP